jgi:Cdc6-like AAA superfamily ATPase
MFKDDEGNYKLKVAFDYDDTLTDDVLFQLAKRMIRKGHDVWILTVRTSNEQYIEHCKRMNLEPKLEGRNTDLINDATELGIADKIIYTDSEDKLAFYQEHQFDILFDDDADWHTNAICEAGGIGVHI